MRQTLLAMPGIVVALLPKLFCPLCWPLYAGVVSSIGLGFLAGSIVILIGKFYLESKPFMYGGVGF